MKRLPALLGLAAASALFAGGTWDDVAARFACGQKIQEGEQANGTLYQIEYIPAGKKLGQHERIFTVTLTRVPQDDTGANAQTEASMQSLGRAAVKAGATIHKFGKYSTNFGPTGFFDYTLNGERNIGVIARTAPGMLATYQLATLRNQAPTDQDRRQMLALIGAK